MFNTLSGKALTSRFAEAPSRRLERIIPRPSLAPLRSVVVQGNDPLEPPVRGKRDLLDAHFGVLEQFVAALLQRFAPCVQLDQFVQRDCPFSS